MKTIHKYDILFSEEIITISIPEGGQIIELADQDDTTQIWVIIDKTKPLVKRKFKWVGTGWNAITDQMNYVGTVHQPPYVWHLFELI